MNLSVPLTLLLIFTTILSFGQKKYNSPPTITGDGYKIIITEIESEKDETKFDLEVFNTSRNQYLTIDPKQIGVEYPGLGFYLPSFSKKTFVLGPGKKRSTTIKVDGDSNHKTPSIQVHVKGVRSGVIPSESVALDKMEFSSGKSGAIETLGLTIDVKKVKAGKEDLSVSTNFVFSATNTADDLFLFDPSAVSASTKAGADIFLGVTPKKTQVIDIDHSLKVNLKVEGILKTIFVDWDKALRHIALKEVDIAVFTVYDKATLKEAAKPKPIAVEAAIAPAPATVSVVTPAARPAPIAAPVLAAAEPVVSNSIELAIFDSPSISAKPKVKNKKGVISLDDVEYLTVRKEGETFVYANLMGDVVLEFKLVNYEDKVKVSDSNPTGNVYYAELYFAGSNTYGEKTAGMAMKKKVSGIVYIRKIIGLNGVIDRTKADAYIDTLGTAHTRRKKELNPSVIIERETLIIKQSQTTIVDNSNPNAPQGSGKTKTKNTKINLNVGALIGGKNNMNRRII
jgi:hypothetical protein